MERSYVEAPATYVQSEVQPAYLTHQYQQPAPVFNTGYSPLAYQLQIPYSAPAPIVTHSNYAAPPVSVETVAVSHRAEPVAVATPTNHVEPVAVAVATQTNYVEPVALAAQTAPVAAVAVASHGDYPSVSPATLERSILRRGKLPFQKWKKTFGEKTLSEHLILGLRSSQPLGRSSKPKHAKFYQTTYIESIQN